MESSSEENSAEGGRTLEAYLGSLRHISCDFVSMCQARDVWTNGPRKEYAALERSVGGHGENPRSSLTSLTKTQCLIEYPLVFKL